jgi:WD40 repeat protein
MARYRLWVGLVMVCLSAGCGRRAVEPPAPVVDAPAEATERQPPLPPHDVAVLEVEAPPGTTVALDGKVLDRPAETAGKGQAQLRALEIIRDEVGTTVVKSERRRYEFRSLEPNRVYEHEVEVRLPAEEASEKRKVFLRGGTVTRWTPSGKVQLPELVLQTGHLGFVKSVVFSPDGRYVLTGAWDQTAILWETATGRQLRTYQGHVNRVNSAAFHPGGRQVATGSYDQTAILWDLASGARILTYSGHDAGVTSVAFHPSGRQLVTAATDQTAILWDTETGKQLQTFGKPVEKADRNDDRGTVVQFHPSGNSIVVFADAQAVFWNVASGREIRRLRLGVAPSGVFSPEGDVLLTTFYGGAAVLWDVATGERVQTLQGPREYHIDAVAFSADGRLCLTGARDGTVTIWERASGRPVRSFNGHTTFVTAVAFSPDGRLVLSGSNDHRAILWDAASGQAMHVLEGLTHLTRGRSFRVFDEVRQVESVSYSADSRQLLVGYWDASAVVWDGVEGRPSQALRGHTGAVTSVAFSPGGRQAVTGSLDKTAILWDLATGQPLQKFQGHSDSVCAVASTHERVLTGSDDKTLILWDASGGRPVHTLVGHQESVNAVALDADGKHILSGSRDKTAILWDLRTGQPLRTFQGHTDSVESVAFSPDGTWALTGSQDGTAVLWETSSGRPLRTFEGHWKEVMTAAFAPDGGHVLTGSRDRMAILSDARTGRQLFALSHPKSLLTAGFRPDGRHLVTGSTDGMARIWDAASADELCRLVCIDGGRDWAVVTPEGLFDGSPGGREKVCFRIGGGLNVVPLDRFIQDNYYPGLLAAIWRGERPRPGKPLPLSPAPLVKILVHPDPQAKDHIQVDVALTDQGGGIRGPFLKHNHALVRAANTLVRRDGKTEQHRFRVRLVGGDNRVEVRAATADGSWESEPAVWTGTSQATQAQPQLHVLTIGINQYAKGAGVANLRFCVSDAQAMGRLFQAQSAGLFDQVHVIALFDARATRAGILEAVSAIARKAGPQDALVVFAASHGITLGQRYFLVPHDFRRADGDLEEAIRKSALAIDDLGEALAEVPALRRVLIFDTCQAGGLTGLASRRNLFGFRGAIERFSRAQGVYCLAAAAAEQSAAEEKELGHGLLTYSLLAAMRAADRGPLARKALPAAGGGVDVLDWFRFAQREVPGLSRRYGGRAQSVEISGEDQPGFALFLPPSSSSRLPREAPGRLSLASMVDGR